MTNRFTLLFGVYIMEQCKANRHDSVKERNREWRQTGLALVIAHYNYSASLP